MLLETHMTLFVTARFSGKKWLKVEPKTGFFEFVENLPINFF